MGDKYFKGYNTETESEDEQGIEEPEEEVAPINFDL